MNRFTLSLVCCFFSLWATAQEDSPVEGNVYGGLEPLEGVHILNVSTDKFSVSDLHGRFLISLSHGDTLVFSHVSMQDLIKVVGEKELAGSSFSVFMLEESTELDEVLLEEERDYALELGIISERKEKPSTYERRLQTAGDFKPIQLFGILGGGLPFHPILNAINGRTKEMKRNIRVEKKMETLNFLKTQYLDYMCKTFDRPVNEIEIFLDHLLEQPGLEQVLLTENPDQMKFYLVDQWFRFQDRNKH